MTPTRATLGVDVGGTATKAGLVDRSGAVLLRFQRASERNAGTKGIIAVVEELVRRAGGLGLTVEGIGVGAAGFIDADSGSVTFAPNIVYDDPQIADAVRSRVGVPVIVDNDANAAVWGERSFGAASGSDHVAYVTVGTGIGSGFVVQGRLLRGFSGAAAELGHTIVDPAGPRCGCGLRGCLEQFGSGIGIARMARELLPDARDSSILAFAGSIDAVSAEDVARAAHQYDETARRVLANAGRYLGIGLSNIANMFDPEVIVLSGSVIKAGEPFLGPVRDELFRLTAAQRRRPMRLDVTSLGGDAGIVGAAALAWEEVSGS
jgi:glucokinase